MSETRFRWRGHTIILVHSVYGGTVVIDDLQAQTLDVANAVPDDLIEVWREDLARDAGLSA